MNAHSKRRGFSIRWIATVFVAAAAGGLSAGESEKASERLTIGWIGTEADWTKGSSAAGVGILHVGPWGGGADLSDRSLVNLAEYRNLKTLIVYSDEVTDEGVLHIAKVKSLEAVVFYECQLTDDGIQPLSKLPKLQTVGFNTTGLTDEGLDRLARSLPEATIEKYEAKYGEVFDANGCLRTRFLKKHVVRVKQGH